MLLRARPANGFIRFSTGEFPQAERFQRLRDDLVRRLHWDAIELPNGEPDFVVDYLVSFPVVVIAARKMSATHLFRADNVTDAKGRRTSAERKLRRAEEEIMWVLLSGRELGQSDHAPPKMSKEM